jgi:hypothetical protein
VDVPGTTQVIATRRVGDRNPIEWANDDADPDETERIVEYTTSVSSAKDRLRVKISPVSHIFEGVPFKLSQVDDEHPWRYFFGERG